MDDKRTKTVSTGTLLKSSFWYTLSGFLTRAIGFITIPIFTRILTNGQVGDFSVYASWQAILLIICGIEVYNTINRARFDYPNEKDFDTYITSCLVLSTIITAIVFGLYILFQSIFYKVLLIEHKYMVIMFMYLFTVPAYSMFQAKQRVTYKYKLSAAIAFTLVLSSSILALLLAVHLPSDRLFGRIIGQYALYITTGFFFYVYFVKKSASVKIVYFKYALRLGLPLVFSYLGSSILLSSDNFVVKHMCPDVQVSYIALVHSATHIILILVQTLNSAWSPWFFDKLYEGQTDIIRKTFKIYVWLIVSGTFLVLLFGSEIIMLLGGKKYTESLYILPVNILIGVFTVLNAQMVNLETYYKKPEYAAVITGIIAAVNVGLNIIGVMFWGYRAVCYVTIACHMLSVLLHYHITRKMNIHELIKPVDLAAFIIAPLLLIPISLFLYGHQTVRFTFMVFTVVLILVTGYIRKDLIIEGFRRFKGKR